MLRPAFAHPSDDGRVFSINGQDRRNTPQDGESGS
jgi:hypothetical protein